MDDLDAMTANAVANELEALRADALRRGVGFVTVGTLAVRARELREHARRRVEATEANLRRVMQVDADRNYGIWEET